MRHSTAIHSATRIPTAVSALLAASALLLGSGCQNAKYVDPKGNELVVNVDRMNIQDWSMLSDQVVQSMVSSGTLARLPAQPAGLLLNPVVNTTTQQFDTDAIMKKIRISLLNTGKAEIIMTSGPGGRAEDPSAQSTADARAFASGTDNQLNEKRLPDATLTAKLLEDRSRSGSTRQVAYILQMSLTDTNRETAVWEGEAQVVKQGTKSSVGF
jgi:PBP1b-binding outer membrane lipoprotein LpoB